MTLRDDLYKIIEKREENGTLYYTLRLNTESVIYKAHFPGMPVTPGVCLVQIGRELLEDFTGHRLEVSVLKNVKFVSVVEPLDGEDILYEIRKIEPTEDGLRAQIQVLGDGSVKAKISILCVKR